MVTKFPNVQMFKCTKERGWARHRGMVLVDALVATVLLGLSLAVVMSLVSRALTLQREGERLEVAAMLVDEQLNLVLARGAENYASRFGLAGKCDVPYQDYSYVIAIEGAGGTDAFLVTATVSWKDGGRERSESVQTRIAARRGDEADPERRPKEAVERF